MHQNIFCCNLGGAAALGWRKITVMNTTKSLSGRTVGKSMNDELGRLYQELSQTPWVLQRELHRWDKEKSQSYYCEECSPLLFWTAPFKRWFFLTRRGGSGL